MTNETTSGNLDNVQTESILWGWSRFCAETTGETRPINFIGDDENILVVGFEADMDSPPIVCLNGKVVRRLACAFVYDKEDVVWH